MTRDPSIESSLGRIVDALAGAPMFVALSLGGSAGAGLADERSDLDIHAYWREHNYTPTAEDLAKAQRGARLLTRIRLYEISPVAVPANPRAVIAAVRGGRRTTPALRVPDDGRWTKDERPGVGDEERRVARRLFAAYQRVCARALGVVDG